MILSEILVNACICHMFETSINNILGGLCNFTCAKGMKNANLQSGFQCGGVHEIVYRDFLAS